MSSATLEAPEAVAMPGTPEWLQARSTGIGASEAGAACGMSRWATPLDIYCRKRGLLPEQEDNDAMRLGRKLEPVVISEFSDRTGIAIRRAPCPMFRHPEHSWMLATPDAQLDTTPDELLECKTTGFRTAQMLGDEGGDDVPTEVVFQAQQQIEVLGVEVCHVAYLIDGRTLRLHRVQRHDKLIGGIIAAEAELWERIQKGEPPDPDWAHPRTPELIKQLYKVESGKTVILPDSVAQLRRNRNSIAEQIKRLEEEQKSLDAQVAHAMGDAAIALFEASPEGVPCEFELTRSLVAGGPVSYVRKDYVTIRQRKSKG